jgi:hypothetical protein
MRLGSGIKCKLCAGWRLLHLAGKVIRSAGAWVLKVSHAALEVMQDIRLRTRGFAQTAS